MGSRTQIASAVAALALTAACSSLPERIETLDQARSAVEELEQDPLTREVAPTRFENAQAALDRAEAAYDDNEDLEIIEHDAYVALRNAQIAQQEIEAQRAREELEQGEAERNRVLLQAREREAERAGQLAAERGEALEAQQQALAAQAQQTQQAEARARELEQQTQQLEQELANLEAEETERGWVLTLDNVLFEFDAAELAPGAAMTIDRLAGFLMENPDRNIVIEGHTDSTGPATYNRELAQERADAVRDALMDRGVAPNRIEVRALGEEFPVASNSSEAGRQLNRRVEVVLSEQGGEFRGEQRTAAAEPTEEEE